MVDALPCDRGIPNNVLSRGWHNFQANPGGVVVCTLCGDKKGDERERQERMRLMMRHPDAERQMLDALDVVSDWRKGHLQDPETINMSSRTFTVLKTMAAEDGDGTMGGTVFGIVIKIDDDLPYGAFQCDGEARRPCIAARSDIRQRSDGENPTFAGNA